MGEFGLLNYLVSGFLLVVVAALFKFRTKLYGLRSRFFYTYMIISVIIILHPLLFVLVHWSLIMQVQVIIPYPYSVHDRISFCIMLALTGATFGMMFFIYQTRVQRWWRKRWEGKVREKRN